MGIDGCSHRLARIAAQVRAAPVALLAVVLVGLAGACASPGPDQPVVETNVAVPMRDGVVLRANVWRPAAGGPFPTLLYRTPYGKDANRDLVRDPPARGRARLRGGASGCPRPL